MESMDELQRRANAAGVRFVMTEIEVTSSLLARVALSRDMKERARCLKEAKAAVALVSRLAHRVAFPDSQDDPVAQRIQELKERLDQLSAMEPLSRSFRPRLP